MSPRRPAPLILALLLAGCQEPFEVDRRTLGPFRVAAVGVQDGVASAALWSGQGGYHDQAPTLSWTLDGEPLGEGWDVPVPASGTLGLQVADPDGQVHQASVTAVEAPAAFTVDRAAAWPGDDLSLEARRALATEPVEHSAPSGSMMRLSLVFPEGTDLQGRSTRWMSADGQGSLLELDTFAADTLAEELVYDDGELVDRIPVDEGRALHLALTLDGAGANRWGWVDSAVGFPDPLVRHEGLLLPVDGDVSTGLLAVTLAATEDLWGLQPTDPVAVPDLAEQEALPCAPADRPFRWAWIIEGRCTRDAVAGRRVVLEVW